MDIHVDPVSRVYAEALFRTAQERGTVADVDATLQELVALFRTQPDFDAFLEAPMIDAERKKALVEKAFQGQVDAVIVDFMCLLIDKGRENAFEGAAQHFRVLADEHAGRVRVETTTPHPLTEQLRAALQESLQQKLQRECTLEANVEPDLIGGMVLRIGDKLFDGSVRRQLQRVGDQLMRSSGYEN